MELSNSIQPCQPEDISDALFHAQKNNILDLPEREKEISIAGNSDYDTFFNGLMVNTETYGIFGHMIFNRKHIEVYGQDNIYITSEPRNIAPLEMLTVYRSNGLPVLTVFDWGAASKGWHDVSVLNDNFVNEFYHTITAPTGDQVHSFIFQNFFNFKANCNQALLLNRSKNWVPVYTSATKGLPGIATGASGWSVFEFKKHKTNVSPLPKVPHMLGVIGLQIMDKNGHWSKLNGQVREDHPDYARVFSTPNDWGYKSK